MDSSGDDEVFKFELFELCVVSWEDEGVVEFVWETERHIFGPNGGGRFLLWFRGRGTFGVCWGRCCFLGRFGLCRVYFYTCSFWRGFGGWLFGPYSFFRYGFVWSLLLGFEGSYWLKGFRCDGLGRFEGRCFGRCLHQSLFFLFNQGHFLLGSHFQVALFGWGWCRHRDGGYGLDGEGWFGLLVRGKGCFGDGFGGGFGWVGDHFRGGFDGVFGWGGFECWLGADLCDRLWYENCHCKYKMKLVRIGIWNIGLEVSNLCEYFHELDQCIVFLWLMHNC